MSERVRHTMLRMREASSFVPDIGTADTSDKQRSTECSPKWHEQRTGVACETCAGPFCNFLCDKKLREKDLQEEYKSKVLRLKTAVEDKGRPTLPLRLNDERLTRIEFS